MGRVKWFLYRWLIMVHPAEDIYRVKQFLNNKIFDRFLKTPKNLTLKNSTVNLFNKSFSKNYQVQIKNEYAVLNIKVPVSYNKWRTEPKNEKETPLQYKGKLDYRDFKTVGENKYLFELNRLHVLPVLAYAYNANNDAALLKQIQNIIYTWKEQNPFLHSANWKSGIEAAIRAFNLVVTRLLLQKSSVAGNVCIAIDKMVSAHYVFLKNHISLYSSANNHLLKELFGLTVIASVYDYKDSEEDLQYYFSFYQTELLKQTYEDGGSKEQSIHYLAAVLNCSFLVALFAIKAGTQPNKLFEERLEKMCIFLDEMSLGGKTESLFGDKDDSNILYDVFDADFNLYHSLLFTGKRLFKNIQYNYFKGQQQVDFINFLFYDDIILKDAVHSNIGLRSVLFPASGYFIFKSQQTNSRLLFDVGEMGLAPLAAHGHSDALHFTLWINNLPVIVDPGVYQYNKKFIKWRNYFRSAAAHNTISINNKDHATPHGVMMWGDLPEVKLCNNKIDEDYSECEAEVLVKQPAIVTHTRKIAMHDNRFVLKDSLHAKKDFQFTYSLHFHPLVEVSIENDILYATRNNFNITIKNKFFAKAFLLKGEENEKIAGWYSSRYDVKEATTTMQFYGSAKKELEFETVITVNV